MDGSDEANEGEWIFTSTEIERPYIPNLNAVDRLRNCLEIVSATELGNTKCDFETNRAIVCESKGNTY